MTLRERDCLLLLLAIAAGATDSWSYFGLGHVFIANMTGNTVLLGEAISRGRIAGLVSPATAVACYVAGVLLGTVLLDLLMDRQAAPQAAPREQVWPRQISWLLGLETLLLASAAAVWAGKGAATPWLQHGLVATVAVAMGIQSAAMLSLQLPGLVTTYITGTWTTLVAGISHLLTGKEQKPMEKEVEIVMQVSVLAVYCASAAVSGLLFHFWPPGVGVLPAVAVTVVAVWGLARRPGRVTGAQEL